MSVLEGYLRKKSDDTYDHPLLRVVDGARGRSDVKAIVVEAIRPRDVLGFKLAKIHLHLLGEPGGDIEPDLKTDWDDLLNTALVKCHVRAISVDNEKVRFSLGLQAALQAPENRFGDGYYNGVLVHHIAGSGLGRYPEVAAVLKYVHRDRIDPSSRSYAECRDQIDAAIGGRAHELVEDLKYDLPQAERILATAVAQYLDERFSVTNRKMMKLL